MKKVWDCRRTFLATLAISGLLYIMNNKQEKDFAFEIVGLAGGVAFVNAWQAKGKKDDAESKK